MIMLLDQLLKFDNATPKYDKTHGRVSPLVNVMRTASRRVSSVYLVVMPYLLHSRDCSKETLTKP